MTFAYVKQVNVAYDVRGLTLLSASLSRAVMTSAALKVRSTSDVADFGRELNEGEITDPTDSPQNTVLKTKAFSPLRLLPSM